MEEKPGDGPLWPPVQTRLTPSKVSEGRYSTYLSLDMFKAFPLLYASPSGNSNTMCFVLLAILHSHCTSQGFSDQFRDSSVSAISYNPSSGGFCHL